MHSSRIGAWITWAVCWMHHEPAALLPQMTLGEEVVEDYVAMRLTLRAHPLALLRHLLTPGAGMAP